MIPTDPDFLEESLNQITEFISRQVEEAGADGVVVALSGGIDSALTAAVAVEALEPNHVTAVGLPDGDSGPQQEAIRDAEAIADSLGLELRTCDIRSTVNAVESCGAELTKPTKRALINVPPRVRMALTYFVANAEDRLVLGTGNRSELFTGYFTKHGDGAADLLPLADLYKTQVYALAERLGLPGHILEKEPTAGLYPGQTDREELGLSYDELDPVLHLLVDNGKTVEEVVAESGLSRDSVNRVQNLVDQSRHKRSLPPAPGISPSL